MCVGGCLSEVRSKEELKGLYSSGSESVQSVHFEARLRM